MNVKVSAPGKLIISGEHSAVYGKSTLVSAICLYTECEFDAGRHKELVEFILPEEKFSWALDELIQQAEDLSVDEIIMHADKLVRVSSRCNNDGLICAKVFLTLYMLILDRPVGMRVTMDTDIPIKAGLGSSASMSVCIAAGLLCISQKIKPEDVDVQGVLLTDDKKNIVNDMALVGENVVHGTPSGVDNTIITFGGMRMFVDRRPVNKIQSNAEFFVANTGVEKCTLRQVGSVADLHKKIPKVLDGIFEAISGIAEELGKVFENDGHNESGMGPSLEHLISMNHLLLKSLNVSHQKLDEVCEIAHKIGNLPTKLTGAGGGGCTITLITDSNNNQVNILSSLLTQIGLRCFRVKVDTSGVRIKFNNQE